METRDTLLSKEAPVQGSCSTHVYYSFSRKLRREWCLTFSAQQNASSKTTLNDDLSKRVVPVGQTLSELLQFNLSEYQRLLKRQDELNQKPSASTQDKLLTACFQNDIAPSKITLELLRSFDLRPNAEEATFERNSNLIRNTVQLPKLLQTPRFFQNSLAEGHPESRATYSFLNAAQAGASSSFILRYVTLYESGLRLLCDSIKQGYLPAPATLHFDTEDSVDEWLYPKLQNLVTLLISEDESRIERIEQLQGNIERYLEQIQNNLGQDAFSNKTAQRDAIRTSEFIAQIAKINRRNLENHRSGKELDAATIHEKAALDASNILSSSFTVAPTATGLGELVAAMAYACLASNTTLKSCPTCGTPFALVSANNKTYCCNACREESSVAAPGRKQVSAVYQAVRRKMYNRHGGKKDQTGYFETLSEFLATDAQGKTLGKLYRDNSFISTAVFNEWCNAIKSVKQFHLKKSDGAVYCEYAGQRINPPIPIIWNGRLCNVSVPCKLKERKGKDWTNLVSLLKRNANLWHGDNGEESCEELAGFTVTPLRWLNSSIGGSQSPLESQLKLDPQKALFILDQNT